MSCIFSAGSDPASFNRISMDLFDRFGVVVSRPDAPLFVLPMAVAQRVRSWPDLRGPIILLIALLVLAFGAPLCISFSTNREM
jgi:hypothetical protein